MELRRGRSAGRNRSPQRTRDRSPLPARRPEAPHHGRQDTGPARPTRQDTGARMEGTPQPDPGNWWSSAPDPPAGIPHGDDSGVYQAILDRLNYLETQLKARHQGEIIDPLNMTVTSELKEKIWAHKFVDLGQLLTKNYQTLEEEKDKRIDGLR